MGIHHMILEFRKSFFTVRGWRGQEVSFFFFCVFSLVFFLYLDQPKTKQDRVTYLLNCATNPCYFTSFFSHKSNKLVYVCVDGWIGRKVHFDNLLVFPNKPTALSFFPLKKKNKLWVIFFFLYLFKTRYREMTMRASVSRF